MKNNQLNNPHKRQAKDNQFQAQIKRGFPAPPRHPTTMLMVSIETGVMRATICRYVAEQGKESRIQIARKGIYPISKHIAGYYTTNPDLFPAIVEFSNTDKL